MRTLRVQNGLLRSRPPRCALRGRVDNNMNGQEELALERTRLANERTLLAYVRTALSLIAGGVVVLEYLAEGPEYVLAGWLLLASGAVVLTIGFIRFATVRSKVNE